MEDRQETTVEAIQRLQRQYHVWALAHLGERAAWMPILAMIRWAGAMREAEEDSQQVWEEAVTGLTLNAFDLCTVLGEDASQMWQCSTPNRDPWLTLFGGLSEEYLHIAHGVGADRVALLHKISKVFGRIMAVDEQVRCAREWWDNRKEK